ncbi:hypothetical protein IMX07_12455 [bacterium]|nr:hypothetical protein [bacterium]
MSESLSLSPSGSSDRIGGTYASNQKARYEEDRQIQTEAEEHHGEEKGYQEADQKEVTNHIYRPPRLNGLRRLSTMPG